MGTQQGVAGEQEGDMVVGADPIKHKGHIPTRGTDLRVHASTVAKLGTGHESATIHVKYAKVRSITCRVALKTVVLEA